MNRAAIWWLGAAALARATPALPAPLAERPALEAPAGVRILVPQGAAVPAIASQGVLPVLAPAARPAPAALPAPAGIVDTPAVRLMAAARAAETISAASADNTAEAASDAGRRSFDGPPPSFVDAGELGRLTGAKAELVAENIFHLNFPTQHLLAATFLRFQEHYESPKYRGKVFTWEEFMDWYAADRGKFSYFEDWAGFNIPSHVLRSFYRGLFDPLTLKEKALLEVFRAVEGRFYIIGTYGEQNEDTLRHEIAHGLFYRDAAYRRQVQEILKTVDLAPIFKVLVKMGYGTAVLEDEAHAYLGDDLDVLAGQGIDVAPYRSAHEALLSLYRAHAGRAVGPTAG